MLTQYTESFIFVASYSTAFFMGQFVHYGKYFVLLLTDLLQNIFNLRLNQYKIVRTMCGLIFPGEVVNILYARCFRKKHQYFVR